VKNGPNSKYTHWYSFKSFPVKIERNPNYAAWLNFASMPKLNYGNPEVMNYMLGVPQFWQTEADVAGWRLDAANEVTSDYWRAFRSKVKSINRDAWILGEVWGDASQWLKGDQWDSAMNYPFRAAVVGFVGKNGTAKASDLMNNLMRNYTSYAPQVSRNMMNLIGSHDTPRILTECGGDRSLAKLAAILQFTWVGTPSVYYGDELGMEGSRDPENRRGMTWLAVSPQNDFLSLYKKLIKTRNENPALQSGDPVSMLADDTKRVVAFARVLDGTADVIALNRSDFTQNIDLNLSTVAGLPKTVATVDFTNALNGSAHAAHQSILHLQLAPRSAAVLIPRLGYSPHLRHRRRDLSSANLATSLASAHKEPK
jgi:glycosidase